jgi:hypothetical protein
MERTAGAAVTGCTLVSRSSAELGCPACKLGYIARSVDM